MQICKVVGINRVLENGQKCYRECYGFLPQIYIRVILPSSLNEIMLSNTVHAISLIFLNVSFPCRPKSVL